MAQQNWSKRGNQDRRPPRTDNTREDSVASQIFKCTRQDISTGEEAEITFNEKWITQSLDANAIQFANCLGEYLCDLKNHKNTNAMTTSQIRNFFGEVRRIQLKGYDENKSSFLLLRPKLAYAKARVIQKNKTSRITKFFEIFDTAHPKVTTKESFQNYVDFLEAVLAYHKFYGGQ